MLSDKYIMHNIYNPHRRQHHTIRNKVSFHPEVRVTVRVPVQQNNHKWQAKRA